MHAYMHTCMLAYMHICSRMCIYAADGQIAALPDLTPTESQIHQFS